MDRRGFLKVLGVLLVASPFVNVLEIGAVDNWKYVTLTKANIHQFIWDTGAVLEEQATLSWMVVPDWVVEKAAKQLKESIDRDILNAIKEGHGLNGTLLHIE